MYPLVLHLIQYVRRPAGMCHKMQDVCSHTVLQHLPQPAGKCRMMHDVSVCSSTVLQHVWRWAGTCHMMRDVYSLLTSVWMILFFFCWKSLIYSRNFILTSSQKTNEQLLNTLIGYHISFFLLPFQCNFIVHEFYIVIIKCQHLI